MFLYYLSTLFFPRYLWQVKTNKKIVFLTFDDGPTEVTTYVLNELKKMNAMATFFCVGDNVKKYPEIFSRIVSEGHSIGNHTMTHVKGWRTNLTQYIDETDACEKLTGTKLFRPPYGRITKKQGQELLNKGYTIVMWDILSKDYKWNLNVPNALKRIKKRVHRGSIIVFHDQPKAEQNLKNILPELLEHFRREGFQFGILSSELKQ